MAMSTLPSARSASDCFDFFGRAEPAEHLDAHRERLEAALERLEMLER